MRLFLKSILATVLYIVILEFAAGWIFIPISLGLEEWSNYYHLTQGFAQFIVCLFFIVIISKRNKESIWNKTKFSWYIIAVLAGILFVLFHSPLNWLYNIIFNTELTITYDFDVFGELNNINLLSTVIFIPIAEELFY